MANDEEARTALSKVRTYERWATARGLLKALVTIDQAIDSGNTLGLSSKTTPEDQVKDLHGALAELQKTRNRHAIWNHYGRVLATVVIGAFGASFLFTLYANSAGTAPAEAWFRLLLKIGFVAAPLAYIGHSYILIWDVVLDRYGTTIALLRSGLAASEAATRVQAAQASGATASGST